MTYLIENSDRGGVKIDMPRFAKDLAKALKGKVGPDGEATRQTVLLPEHLSLFLYTSYSDARVRVSISASDVPHGDRNFYDKTHKTSEATLDPCKRTIDKIAADIQRRVIDASAPAIEAQRAYAAVQVARRNGLTEAMAEIKRKMPSLNISQRQGEDQRAYFFTEGHDASGQLYADGTVSIERMGNLSIDTFVELMALLNKKTKRKPKK